MHRRSAPRALLATLVALPLAACGTLSGGGDSDRVDVVAAFYPLQLVAERVGGDAVVVTGLTKPGAEPHDLELTPLQVGQISDAEVVLHVNGFQPAVDDAVAQEGGDRALDAADEVPLLPASEGGRPDPHFWLDPTRLATLADAVAKRLGAADPDRAGEFTDRAARLRAELDKLDKEYADGLRTCQRRELVVSHEAFAYLADRYDLEQIGISGLSPEDEPSARRLAEVAEAARASGATTIFFETLVSPKVAETIAREVGADTAVLDPLEGVESGSADDYFSVMRKNLTALRTALGCR
jgi:zinc transport system substrate-binding protein